jgi:hypothetical protein
VVTLFAPPALRVSPQAYAHLLRDAALRQQLPLTTSRRPLVARILACQRAWARRGWRPYQRWRRFGWSDGDLTITPDPDAEEA